MIKRGPPHPEFYGTTRVGEKGQVVIPAEARKALKLERGDKLLVLGMGEDMLAFTKLASFERFVSTATDRLEMIRKVIKKANGPGER